MTLFFDDAYEEVMRELARLGEEPLRELYRRVARSRWPGREHREVGRRGDK